MSKARNLADLLATVAVQSDLPTAVSDLTNDTGFITGVAFTDVTSKPTTLSGYGITDAVNTTHTGSVSITGTISATGNIESDADVVAYASS